MISIYTIKVKGIDAKDDWFLRIQNIILESYSLGYTVKIIALL